MNEKYPSSDLENKEDLIFFVAISDKYPDAREFNKKTGERLRSCRKTVGYNQEKLARLANVSRHTISNYENNCTSSPNEDGEFYSKNKYSYSQLAPLLKALKISFKDFFKNF